MKNVFLAQYQTAKAITEKINSSISLYRSYGEIADKNKDEYYAKAKDEHLTNAVRLNTLLLAITGYETEVTSSAFFYQKTESKAPNCFMASETFRMFENTLLNNDLIEYGDTLTDEQKLAYYERAAHEAGEEFFM